MNIKYSIYIIVLILFIFSFGCEDLNNPGEIIIKNSLFYNLQVSDTLEQHVYIYRNPDLSGNKEYYAEDPYINFFNKNAEITLRDPSEGKDINFKFTQDTVKRAPSIPYPYKPYFTNQTPFKAKPLNDYYLYVNTEGNIITGKATTPGDFEIFAPRKDEVITGPQNLDNYIIRWSSSKNAKIYTVRISGNIKAFPFEGWLSSDFATADINATFESLHLSSFGIDSGEFILQVVAHDNNYFQHYYNKKEIVGITGAYGCLSSSVVKQVRFFYKK